MLNRIKGNKRNPCARSLQPRIYYFFLLMLYGLTILSNTAFADTSLSNNTLDMISKAVFEIVVSKPVKDSLSYERPLPMDLLPFSIRTDKYYPIGTAFAISATEFISAAHVANFGLENLFGEIYLRDKEGKVYSVDKILKYSDHRDFVVFSLKDKTAKDFFEVNTNPEVNQKVYAVGNALGEGVVIRDGLFTSATPEEEKGEWKWIRFSAAASPGNSGGPLLDQNGKVLGIILRKSPNENLNYALPINEVLNAKPNTAIIHRKIGYLLDNSDLSSFGYMNKEGLLPKTFQELHMELIEKENFSFYNLMKSFFKKNKENIFPNGKGSTGLFYKTENALFPSLVMKGDDGNWDISSPKEMKEADLSNNGYLKYGNLVNSLFLDIQKPDDIPLEQFYSNSKLFMNLILKGISFPRQISTEKIKITSLGDSQETYVFMDSYGRKWLVKTWLMEYNDGKVVTFSLPVPGGCITMLRAGQKGNVDTAYISDLKILTNFIYVSYGGTLTKWQEFLKMKDLLPAAFSSIAISFDYKKTFRYKSKRLSFSFFPDVMNISEKSYLKLMFGYFKENDKTTWDVNTISVSEEKNNPNGFSIKRNQIPPKELGDKYQEEWKNIAAQKFPFNRSSYYRDRTTNISTVVKQTKDKLPIVLYTVSHEKNGKVKQNEMQTKLDKLLKNLIVYEDGIRKDIAYENRPDAYHDKGDYHQALFDVEKMANNTPRSADGFIHRGEVYKDKGQYDLSLQEYNKAVRLNPEDVKTYFGKDFIALLCGAKGHFKEAKEEINKVIQSDPLYVSIETVLKIIEDIVNQRIKDDVVVQLFKGMVFQNMGLPDEAFIAYTKAINEAPGYAVSYDIRGLAHTRKGDKDQAIADYSKALEMDPKDIVAYNRRGVAFKGKKEYDKAIADYTRALEIDPTFIKALKNRGNAYHEKKDYDRALADYNSAIQLNPLVIDAYFDRGLSLHATGNFDQAVADFDTTLSKDPKYVGAYMARGLAHEQKNEFDAALSDFNRALELNPRYSGAYNNRGNIFLKKGDRDQAFSDYNKAIEEDSKNEMAYNNRGAIYQDKGELDKAISDYSQSIEINPNFFNAYKNRGMVYHKKGQYDFAITDYNKAIEINPKHAQAFFNRGLSFQEKKEFDLALSDYNKAIEINPNNSDAYNNRGNTYKAKGNRVQAIADYNKSIEFNPRNEAAYKNRGIVYQDRGEYDLALFDYNKAIEINPNNSDAYNNRGNIYSKKGDSDRAIFNFNKAIEINPLHPSAYYNRGIIYNNMSDQERAIADFSKAIDLNPNFFGAYVMRGNAYSQKNEFDLALADYNKVIEGNPKDTLAYLNRGNIFWRRNERERAFSDYDKAIDSDPRSAEAYNTRGFAFAFIGKYQEAFSDLNKAIEINPKYAAAYDNRGIAYGRKGDHDLAIAEFNKALEIDTKNADVYNSRGYTYLIKGDLDQAITDLNRSIELNPKFTLAYINRGNAYYMKRDRDKACLDWKKACINGSCEKFRQAYEAKLCE